MGFDNECIINIQSLKGEYFCPVCRLLVYPKEALQSQCSHLYCKPCLTYVVRTTQACPYDGYLVTEADAKPLMESNKVLADTIGKIPVNCLFHRSGCTWQGQLADCTSHCSGCPFGDSSVMCNRCGVQIVHRQVEEHAQNCPGVQTQAPQAPQVASASQAQTVTATSAPASQAQMASTASAAVQKPAQQVNPATQAQPAQVAMPNTEQWYQQQQQYQQYYQQQYPGYDPYQQQQQYQQQYYPYQQQPVQAVQQFQQPAQVYPSQLPGQQQAPPSHAAQQPQQIAQAPPAAQPQPQPHPPQQQTQQQIQPVGQPQALQNQVAYSAPQQVQPYAHPQTGAPAVPQQGMQMLPYQQARPQMQQPPPPQAQTQPYNTQPQAQQYPHPQTHLPAQTHLHPNSHTATFQPPRPIQPMNHAGPLQAQNAPAHPVTGYQSYQQAQAPPLQQNQAGAPPHSLHMNGLHQQPPNPSQFQGQFPNQPTQVRPPSHISAMMPNQQPGNVHPQVQNTGAPAAQVPAYQHSKHPGYPAQHHSGMQPVQHSSAQPPALPGSGPYVQQHPMMQAPANLQAMGPAYPQNSTHAAIPPNVRPMVSHGGGQQSYSQPPVQTNAAQVPPNQLRTSQPLVNQSYPSQPVYGQELLRPSTADAQIMGKGKQETNNVEPKPIVGSDAKARAFENGAPQNGTMKIKEGTLDNAIELPSVSNSAKEDTKENEQRSDKGFSNSALPPTSTAKQMMGSYSTPSSDPGRNQLGGPSPQHRFPPPGTRGGMIGGVRPDFPEGSLSKPHPPNPIDGRFPELRNHGSMEQRPFGHTPSLHRLQDERMSMLPEEHLKPFPTDHSFGRRDFEGDLHKFPRPSHFDGGNPLKFGPRFPPPHDHGLPHMFGDRSKPGGFRDVGLGGPAFPDFPRPVHGFGHHGSPGRDFRAAPTPGIGGFPHDIDEKAFQQGRFPGHLRRGEFDMQGSDHMAAGLLKHSRVGDAIGQDMRQMHLRRDDFGPHNVHPRDGPFGEPPFPGSFLPPRPFAEPFGREMRGYPHHGEPGFKGHGMRFGHDDGFYRGEMEPFDNPRKRKPGSVMCRICGVDCETVEGLDLHSQTREHQKKAMDMVMSIKQQHSKKQKVSNQRNVLEEGRKNRTASFEGQGKKH